MPYVYVGKEAIFRGRPLFKLLCQLKDFGQGRIVYRGSDLKDYPTENEPSFYRILFAQPEMDDGDLYGRVVAERVFRGIRYPKPQNISDIVHKPDFNLVPRDEEEWFCRWHSYVRNFDAKLDSIHVSSHVDLPPLQRYLHKSSPSAMKAVYEEQPYQPVCLIQGKTEPHSLASCLNEKFSCCADIDPVMERTQSTWNSKKTTLAVGARLLPSYVEGRGWESHVARNSGA